VLQQPETVLMEPSAHEWIRRGFLEAARTFHDSFETLGWTNGPGDLPMPERHSVVHLAGAFLRMGWAVAPEVLLDRKRTGGREHIDLLVHGQGLSIVFEVKSFGKLRFDSVLDDVERLLAFRKPATALFRAADRDPDRWWSESGRWGCVVIQIFKDPAFRQDWVRDPSELLDRAIDAGLDGNGQVPAERRDEILNMARERWRGAFGSGRITQHLFWKFASSRVGSCPPR
jgi:hypothetical protein